MSLDEDDSKKETIKRVVGTNHYRKKVEKDKEVRVGIKDWLVNSLLYKKNINCTIVDIKFSIYYLSWCGTSDRYHIP